MTKICWLLAALVIGVTDGETSSGGPAQSAPTPQVQTAPSVRASSTRPQSRPSEQSWLRHQCMMIANAVNLTPEQWEQVENNIKASEEAKAKWQSEKQGELQELESRLRQARKGKNRATIHSLTQLITPLQQQREEIYGNELDVIMPLLTDTQKLDYETWILFRTVTRTYAPAGMDSQQEVAVRKLCKAAAADRMKAPTWRAKTSIRTKLLQTVFKSILTTDQRISQASFELNRSAMAVYKSAILTQQQKAKIYQLCRKVGAERIKVDGWRAKANLRRGMLYTVYHKILTDEQRSKIPEPRPPRVVKKPTAATATTSPSASGIQAAPLK